MEILCKYSIIPGTSIIPIVFAKPVIPPAAWDLSSFSYDNLFYSFPIGGAVTYGFWGNAQGDRFYSSADDSNTSVK